MPFRPAQVHPQEHLRPVGRLGAAGSRADGQQRRTLVVLAGEQQGGPLAPEIGLEPCRVAVELGGKLRVGGLVEQLDGGEQVVDAVQEALPQ
jgi:hypothetical protein